MAFTYRTAQATDATACAQIIRDWGAETPWMASLDDLEPMAASWRDLLASKTAWVAERDGRVVGFCVREDDNITGLYIARTARRSGVGKHLLDLAKKDRDWITVWAYELNTEARRFYQREGLREVSRELEICDDGTRLMDIEHRWGDRTSDDT